MNDELFHGTAVIVGAGFSHCAGIPLAADISREFLSPPASHITPPAIQDAITRQLRHFWETVFGYNEEHGAYPSFEDHFTMLDIAANAGHNIAHYTPQHLRALRRLSIHRVFEILDAKYHHSDVMQRFVASIAASRHAAIVSTNWDVVAENHFVENGTLYDYQVPGCWEHGVTPPQSAFPLIKLHGSANWHYCDSCRTVQFGTAGKTALIHCTFLEERDFAALDENDVVPDVARTKMGGKPCHTCGQRRTTARVATFSYSKAFDFFLFHASWDAALRRLREAASWTFIGYSLPEADFAFKHLLKTAQTVPGSRSSRQIRVVTRDTTGDVHRRYMSFFGQRVVEFHDAGFEEWVRTYL